MGRDDMIRRARVQDLARRQAEADRARMLRNGAPAKKATIETILDPCNPNQPRTNDN